MKINSKKIVLSSLTIAALAFTGCGSSSSGGTAATNNNTGTSTCPAQTTELTTESALLSKTVCQLDANILSSLTLTSDKVWSLGADIVKVGDDSTNNPILTIQAGTTVYGKVGGALFVQRGAKINAVGTALAPIVMTGEAEVLLGNNITRGQWAGLVIAGKGTNNGGAIELSFEFDATLKHGGTNSADSSGVLKYLVVKHAGQPILPDKEFNAITLGSVGSGTIIDYVEAYNGKDDGIELFGGNVNMSHLVLIGNDDDQLDTDEGYNGYSQWVYAETTTSGEGDPSGFEFSSTNSASYGALPKAVTRVANFTIVGAPLSVMNAGGSFSTYNGIRTKDETLAHFVNGEVIGFTGIDALASSGMWRHQNHGLSSDVSDVTMDGVFFDAAGETALAFATDATALDFAAAGAGNSYGEMGNLTATAQDENAVLGGTFIQTTNTIGASVNTWATGWAVKADGTNF